MIIKGAIASALLLSAIAAAPAQAGTKYALTCIGSETGYTINYQYRWGNNGSWQTASVKPGAWKNHRYNYKYEGENSAPQLQVRYDDDASSGSNMVITKLDSYAASYNDCEAQGKTYDFYETRGELNLQAND